MNFYDRENKYITMCKCSKCGKDTLVDNSMILTSMPPKYNYECLFCGYKGYVFCDETNIYPVDKLSEETKEKIKQLSKIKNFNIHFNEENTQSLNGNGETLSVIKKVECDEISKNVFITSGENEEIIIPKKSILYAMWKKDAEENNWDYWIKLKNGEEILISKKEYERLKVEL